MTSHACWSDSCSVHHAVACTCACSTSQCKFLLFDGLASVSFLPNFLSIDVCFRILFLYVGRGCFWDASASSQSLQGFVAAPLMMQQRIVLAFKCVLHLYASRACPHASVQMKMHVLDTPASGAWSGLAFAGFCFINSLAHSHVQKVLAPACIMMPFVSAPASLFCMQTMPERLCQSASQAVCA